MRLLLDLGARVRVERPRAAGHRQQRQLPQAGTQLQAQVAVWEHVERRGLLERDDALAEPDRVAASFTRNRGWQVGADGLAVEGAVVGHMVYSSTWRPRCLRSLK